MRLRLLLKIHPIWSLTRKTRFGAPTVVKLKVTSQTLFGCCDGVIAIYIDFFVFHGPPQSFDKDIITPRPSAIHPDSNAACLEGPRIGMTGQLAPLICIHDVGFSITGDGGLNRLQTELNIHRDGHSPGQHPARIPVHPSDQKCCTWT